ncbi:MAG: hypothetical protein U0610_12210 [bacterium]
MTRSREHEEVLAELAERLSVAHLHYRERKQRAESMAVRWEWFTESQVEIEPFGKLRRGSKLGRRVRNPRKPDGKVHVGVDGAGQIWCERLYQALGWHFESFVFPGIDVVEQWLYSYNSTRAVRVDVPYAPLPDRAACWVKRHDSSHGVPRWTAEVAFDSLRWEEYLHRNGRLEEIVGWSRVRAGGLAGVEHDTRAVIQYDELGVFRIENHFDGEYCGEWCRPI